MTADAVAFVAHNLRREIREAQRSADMTNHIETRVIDVESLWDGWEIIQALVTDALRLHPHREAVGRNPIALNEPKVAPLSAPDRLRMPESPSHGGTPGSRSPTWGILRYWVAADRTATNVAVWTCGEKSGWSLTRTFRRAPGACGGCSQVLRCR